MLSLLKLAISFLPFTHTLAAVLPDPVTGNTSLHDPTLCKDDSGKYWLFSSGTGIEIRTSTDRVEWENVGVMFPDGSPWAAPYIKGNTNGPLWAPDCTYINGEFWVYYAASTTGNLTSGIFLAKSSTGQPGSWTNEGLVTSTNDSSNYNAIDPNLIIDSDGKWYLSFGSFWDGIKLASLDPSSGKFSSQNLGSLARRNASDDNGAIEASTIYQNGTSYYLFTSWDKCCLGINSTYNIRVGRSSNVTGPYVDQAGKPLLEGGGTQIFATHGSVIGPGGEDVLFDKDGPIIVYHYYTPGRDPIGVLGIDHLDFSSGWPIIVQ
ncbi:Arabinan endo-1,5-alpha-L-arabinosidase [Abortiporus biennis]